MCRRAIITVSLSSSAPQQERFAPDSDSELSRMKIDDCTIQIEEEGVNSVLNTVQLNTRITYFDVEYCDPFHSLISQFL